MGPEARSRVYKKQEEEERGDGLWTAEFGTEDNWVAAIVCLAGQDYMVSHTTTYLSYRT